jgi:hypothetical protein
MTAPRTGKTVEKKEGAMNDLRVAKSGDHLVRDGRPWFYLADTAWMVFANLPEERWPDYLAYRRMQGFNALQISILPVTHDNSVGEGNIDPFLKDSSGDWDFGAYNPAYFEKAERMVAIAVDQGFVPVLGVLWCSYVPGTRCSANSPVRSAMPREAVRPYAEYAARLFKSYAPMFFISGDTKFESEDEAPYYMTALKAVRAVCPEALLTMHLTPDGELAREFQEAVDFYMYQSGHHVERQDNPYRLAQKFRAYPVKHPVLNAEPCYEGHGRVGSRTRFTRFDVRKALWQSLLAGAKMGFTYGGHGIWSCHRRGMKFLNDHRSFEPFDWERALRLEGAWDASYAKWIFETQDLFGLEPVDGPSDDPEIVMAADPEGDRIAVYSPYPFDLELDRDLSGHRCVLIDLASRRVTTPVVAGSRVQMAEFNGDSLLLAVRE